MTARSARNGRNQGGKSRKKGGGGRGNGGTKDCRSNAQRTARKLTLKMGRHASRRQLKKVQETTRAANAA